VKVGGESLARAPRRERRRAKLQCNTCERLFVAPAWHVEIVASDIPDPVGWVPDTNTGAACPLCGSKAVGVQD